MDPRVTRTHDAVMRAATELLLEGGPSALTVDGVVARSGVAKSTLYRHWATRDELVVDVLANCTPQLEPIPPGATFGEALVLVVDAIAAVMSDEQWNRVLPSLLMLKNELGAAADLEDRFKAEQSDVVESVLRLGVDEGVLAADVLDDINLAVTLLAGPLLMAGLTGMVPADSTLAERVVQQFLAGQGVGAQVTR